MKRFVVCYGTIIDPFGLANLYKKDDAQQLRFKEDLLFVAKTYMPIFNMKSQWLRCLVLMHQNR
jgi:hypothetical protein